MLLIQSEQSNQLWQRIAAYFSKTLNTSTRLINILHNHKKSIHYKGGCIDIWQLPAHKIHAITILKNDSNSCIKAMFPHM